jgi:tRNA-dihydrouridine synthase
MSFLDKLPKPFFVLAPMDDITDIVFRQIIADCARPDLFITEFVNVDGLQSPGREKLLHKLRFLPKEQPIIVQLWGTKPENFYKTVKELVDGTLAEEANHLRNLQTDAVQGSGEARSNTYVGVRGASTRANDVAMRRKHGSAASSAGRQASAVQNFVGVDLNMGCPVKTVIKNGACAALIKNRELAGEIIAATKEAAGSDFPVSVKTRIGFTTVDWDWIEFILEQKLNMLSVHGRTAKQMSKLPANWDLIGQVRERRDLLCPSTKIVGNGDVMTYQQGLDLAKKYKLDGIMIARGALADPFVFSKNSPWANWSKEQKVELYKKHVQLFADTWKNGERKVETLNKFCKIYINGFDGAKELREKLMQAKSTEELLQFLS